MEMKILGIEYLKESNKLAEENRKSSIVEPLKTSETPIAS